VLGLFIKPNQMKKGLISGFLVVAAIAIVIMVIANSDRKPFGYDPNMPSAGVMVMFSGSSAPTGWMICDGSAISRTTYVALFGVIGTTYGSGNGSTTFNIPDLQQRFPMGKAASGTGSTLGGTGGTIDHSHGSPITSGTPSATVAATNLTGTAASTTHTHTVTLTAQNPPFQVVLFLIKL
jgi:microcystin-dependent protein